MKALIPFVGFYESVHDADLDDVANEMSRRDQDSVDWRKVAELYAADYAKRFLDMVKVPGKFSALHSPREYNFATDTIEVEVGLDQMIKAFTRAKLLGLAELVKKEMEPRSGFIPFHTQELEDWGAVANWSAAQCELIFRALAEEETSNGGWEQQDEVDLMEPARSNGRLEGWLYSSLPNKDPVTTVLDFNVRLTYDGVVTREQVAEVLLSALEHCRQESMLSDPEWEEESCDLVELARPQVVMDVTDMFSMDVQCSQPLEVVSISRDPHEYEEAGEAVPYSQLQGTLKYAKCEWPGDKPEPAIVQYVDAADAPEVAAFFKALKEQ